MGSVPLQKRPLRAPLSLLLCEDTEEMATHEPGSRPSPDTVSTGTLILYGPADLDFPCKKPMFVVYKLPVILTKAPDV